MKTGLVVRNSDPCVKIGEIRATCTVNVIPLLIGGFARARGASPDLNLRAGCNVKVLRMGVSVSAFREASVTVRTVVATCKNA